MMGRESQDSEVANWHRPRDAGRRRGYGGSGISSHLSKLGLRMGWPESGLSMGEHRPDRKKQWVDHT